MMTLQPLLQVIQAWQDCHGAYRSMLFGMFVVPSDRPIGDPDVVHLL